MLAIGCESADVTHANGIGIVSDAMCSNRCDWATCVDAAVKVDDVVVADLGETALAVPTVNVGDGEGLAFGRGGTMDYYRIDFSHKSKKVKE